METDFSITERGVRFVIQRTHRGNGFFDEYAVFDYDGTGSIGRGRNTLFGEAWNSTLQMYSYWRWHGCDHGHAGIYLIQHTNLGGYYLHDLRHVSGQLNGQFEGPGDLDWMRFEAYPDPNYEQTGHSWHRIYKNRGLLTTRDGMRYYFDYSLPVDPNDPNSNSANSDNVIQLLRRKENRYGQGYDYTYGHTGTCGQGDVQYRLEKVRTPSGRSLVFHYDPNSYGFEDPNEFDLQTTWPNHVTSVDLLNADDTPVQEGVVRYEYYGPNHPVAPGQLHRVTKGCDCGGGHSSRRVYVYEHGTHLLYYQYDNHIDVDVCPLVEIRDDANNVLLHNEYDPNEPPSWTGMPPWFVTEQQTPHPNDASQTVTWTYEEAWGEGEGNGAIEDFVEDPEGNRTQSWTGVGWLDPLDFDFWWPMGAGLTLVRRESGTVGQPGYEKLEWTNHEYDNLRRLLMSVTRPDDANEVYTYDDCGRRTQTRTQDPNTGQWYESQTLEYTNFAGFSQVTRRFEPNEPNDSLHGWSYGYTNGNMTSMTGPQVTKGLATDLSSYQPVDTYTYPTSGDANDANFPGNWGLMATHTDPNGMVTKFEYDTYGYLRKKIVDYGGENLTHEYVPDAFGRTLFYTDPNGTVTEYRYNAAGKLEWVFSPEGQVKHSIYDPNTGWLSEEIVFINPGSYDPNNADPNDPNAARVTTYERHPILGHVMAMTQTGVGRTEYGYDPMGRHAKTVTPSGLVVRREYDGFGRLKRFFETEPGESERKVLEYDEYDPMGRVKQVTRYDDPNNPNLGSTTKYAYDIMGRQTLREDPNGTQFWTQYDDAGHTKRQYVLDTPDGNYVSDTTFDYDELGRLWMQRDKIDPNGADDDDHDRIVRTYRYRDGKVQRIVNGPEDSNIVTSYAYDSAGRVTQTVLPGGTTIEPNYYPNGQVNFQITTYKDPNGAVQTIQKVEYVRNDIGQVEQMKVYYDPNLPKDANLPTYETTSFTYTPTGQVETRTDARGMVTYYQYDAQGRVTWTYENSSPTDANYGPRMTQYVYDPNGGSLIEYHGWNGAQDQPTYYAHDARGNVKTITYPNGDQIEMTYDNAGRRLTRQVVGGATIGYAYNSRGLLTTRTSGTVQDVFTYDPLGRMTTAQRKVNGNPQSTITMAYDHLGRLTSETTGIFGLSKTVNYQYDQADRRTQMKLPDGNEVFDYTYTDSGQVDLIKRDNTILVDYDYTGPAVSRRRVYSALDENIHVDWRAERDGLLRLRESANSRNDPGDPNLEVLWATYKYVREPMGLPSSETFALFCDPNGTPRQFEHDELGRLKRVIYGADPNRSPHEIFELDLAGNRKTYRGRNGDDANYVIDTHGANQYTQITPGDANLAHDAAGNLTVDHRGYRYMYDHDNKLSKVGTDSAWLMDFVYDALGRRVFTWDWQTNPSTQTFYVQSGQNEVAEYNGQGQRVRYYVHGPTYIDERVVMHNDPAGGGAPTTGSDYIYLLKDLYTVAGLADERGWPVERYDYDAYGKVHMNRCAVLPWAADLDDNGDVDDDDLAIFEAAYKESGNEPNGVRGWRADLDGDGDVDGSDYVLFADAYNGSGAAPRGEMSLQSGSMVVSRVGNPFFFTGRRLDVFDKQDAGTTHHFTDDYAGLQLYDFRARAYDPVVGRFGQRDPIEYEDGMSSYEYARALPHMNQDPSGEKVVWPPRRPPGEWGRTDCDFETGNMARKVWEELCAGNCEAQHEAEHVRQRADCCRRAAACVKRWGQNVCQALYYQWIGRTNDAAECEAYKVSMKCIQTFLADGRMNDGSPMTSACCLELITAFQRHSMVGGAACRVEEGKPWYEKVGRGCPFTENGDPTSRPPRY